jgi:hypothetical protein
MAVHPSALPAAPAAFAASPLLRFALRLDAVITAVNGVAYLAAAGPLADLLGIPAGALRGLGAFMLVYAATVAVVAAAPRAGLVRAIVAGNLVWVDASIVLLVIDAWTPTTAGSVWIALQAAAVGLFAALQFAGLRRS